VALWLDNDQYLQEQALELAREGGDAYDLGKHYKVYVESIIEDTAPAVFEASFVADIFGYAFEQVDWQEIAEHYLEEVTEDA
jgi:hypothetical protein